MRRVTSQVQFSGCLSTGNTSCNTNRGLARAEIDHFNTVFSQLCDRAFDSSMRGAASVGTIQCEGVTGEPAEVGNNSKEGSKDSVGDMEVLATTLSSAGGVDTERLLRMKRRSTKFDVLIVDEATQATEPSLLIPLSLLKRDVRLLCWVALHQLYMQQLHIYGVLFPGIT
jgi:AAA domain